MRHRVGLLTSATIAALLAAVPLPLRADSNWVGGIGIGYAAPRDPQVADLYGGGVAFHASAGARLAQPNLHLSVEVGYFAGEAGLDGPFFVESPRGELLWIPIDLVARAPLLGESRISPYLGAGLEILWWRERFRYGMAGEGRLRDPGGAFEPGLLLLAGVELSRPPRIGIEGTFTMVPTERAVSTTHGSREEGGDAGFDTGAFGIRLVWRFP